MHAAEAATGIPALALLQQTSLLPSPPSSARILDNACGAGVIVKRLFEHLSHADASFQLTCGDVDGTMENLTAELIAEKQWPNVSVGRIDAHATGFPDGSFSHVLMNFGPQLMRDAVRALGETYRVLASGGIAGFTCWVKAGWVPGVVEVFPEFTLPGLLQTDLWKEAGRIKEVLGEAGFVDVVVEECDFVTRLDVADGFLEFMGLLMPGLLHGENLRKYGRYIRGEVAKGSMDMNWQALIVSARKA
jgi:SAM-dependent methyltransferase